jgi:hypothetical protein
MAVSLSLPASAIKNVNFAALADDFHFVVGESVLACPAFVAELLSPRVSSLRRSDPTVFSFAFADPVSVECVASLVSLAEGEAVTVGADALAPFLRVADALGATALLFDEGLFRGELAPGTVLERVVAKAALGGDCGAEVAYAAAHFYDIPGDVAGDAPLAVLSAVLGHPALVVESEDRLFEWVLASGHTALLEHVRFEHLSLGAMQVFQERSPALVPLFNERVVAAICARLLLPVHGAQARSDRWIRKKAVACPFDFAHKLAGIVHYLTNLRGQHAAHSGEITVSASSNSPAGNSAPANAADISPANYFCSEAESRPALTYDFGAKRVRLNGCSIRSRADLGPNGGHLRAWMLEGSADGQLWTKLVQQSGDMARNNRNAISSVSFESSEPFRYVRIVMLGPNWAGNMHMSLSYWELFGEIEWP